MSEIVAKRVAWIKTGAVSTISLFRRNDSTVPNTIRILKHSGQKTLHYGAASTIASNFVSGEFIMVTFGEEEFFRVPDARASNCESPTVKVARSKEKKKGKSKRQGTVTAMPAPGTVGLRNFASLGAAILDGIGAAPLEHRPKVELKPKKKKVTGGKEGVKEEEEAENEEDLEAAKRKHSKKIRKKGKANKKM